MRFCQEYGHYCLSIINKNPLAPGIILLLDVKIKRNSVNSVTKQHRGIWHKSEMD